MEERGKVAVISLDGIHSTMFHAASVNGRTSEQIIKDNKLKTNIIGITTPYIQRALGPNEVPSSLYPKIIRTDDCGRYRLPAYYLTVMNENQKNKITFYVNVRSTQKFKFPKFPVTIDPQQFSDKTLKDLLEFIDHSFTFSHSDSSLQIGSFVPPDDYPANELLNQARTKNLTLKCTLNKEYLAIINRRTDLLKELHQTEKQFIKSLKDFISYWPSCLMNEHLITFDEIIYIFKFYKKLIEVHSILELAFEERGTFFDSEYSDIFCDFSENFKESVDFCKSLTSVESMFEIKSQNKAWNEKLEEIYNSTLNPSSKTLLEFLDLPIEQYNKYLTFLLQLRTVTPPTHPDSRLLTEVIEKYQVHYDSLKDIKRLNEQSPQITSLQDSLHGFVIISPNRELLKSYNVKIIEPIPQKGTLHLFNNLILLTTTKMRKEQVLFERKLCEFRYNINDSVLTFSKSQRRLFDFKIELSNKEETNELTKMIEDSQIESYKANGHYDKIMIYTLLNLDQQLPNLSYHQCVIYNKHIYYFGGKNNNEYSHNIIDINLNTMKHQQMECPIGDLIYHSVVSNKDKIYIFGGLNSNEQISEKFWQYTPATNDWEELELPSEGGRYGHTLVSYANDLYLFGGRNSTKVFADLQKFDTISKKWTKIDVPGSPKPRYFHTATTRSNYMLIFGGKDKANVSLSTLFLFDINTHQWKRSEVIGEPIQGRYLCQSFAIHKWFFCMGGTNGTEIFEPFCVCFSNTRTTSYNLRSGGNDRQALLNFSLSAYRSSIYIYGGILTGSENSSNMLFKVELPNLLKQFEEKSRNTIAVKPIENFGSSMIKGSKQSSGEHRKRHSRVMRRRSHIVTNNHPKINLDDNETNLQLMIKKVPSPKRLVDMPAPLDSLNPGSIISEPNLKEKRKKKPPLPPRRKSDETLSQNIGEEKRKKQLMSDISGVPPLDMIEDSYSTENSSEIKFVRMAKRGIRTMSSQPIIPLVSSDSNGMFPPPLSSSDDEQPPLSENPKQSLPISIPPPLGSSDDEENVTKEAKSKISKPPKPPSRKRTKKNKESTGKGKIEPAKSFSRVTTLQQPIPRISGPGKGNVGRISLPRGGAIPAFSPGRFPNARTNSVASLARGTQLPSFANVKTIARNSSFTLPSNQGFGGNDDNPVIPAPRKRNSSSIPRKQNSLEIGAL
ncbi:Kelch motif family protein [Histomonas meleagridis]|uniref:Kelch motif family protein n=1 Tax=Histomonas meleagridis TaxID=135588 RepID=UPI00355A698F|nr:Kelch motif family protein [Histomonas meleagridis]KAH0802203.1 Kelch motif family protein [Histomonas meleagridis]